MTFACAHRGDSSNFRENTVAAVMSAIAKGADIVEIDVRITRDGHVVVLHDESLERLWGLPKDVADVDLAQVLALGEGDNRIPLLTDVLELFVGKSATLMIDMEQADPAQLAFEVTTKGPLSAEQIAWCGHIDGMRKIRELSPDARIWMPWNEVEEPDFNEVNLLAPEFINMHYSYADRRRVARFHENGFKVSVWTVQDEPTMRWAVDIWIDSITSDYLETLLQICEQEQLSIIPQVTPADISEIDVDYALEVAKVLGRWAILISTSVKPGHRSTKTDAADIVTVVDVMIENHVREVIQANFPSHNFVGEELGGEFITDTPTWYLDPIDGTTNFANTLPWSSFSLALAHNRTPLVCVVTQPWLNTLFDAQRGKGAHCNDQPLFVEVHDAENPLSSRIVLTELAGCQLWPGMLVLLEGLAENFCTPRIMGSGTLALTGVAAHYGVGAVIGDFSPIDHLAAVLIVSEAGGVVLNEKGEKDLFPETGGIMCATRAAAEPLFNIWKNAIKE